MHVPTAPEATVLTRLTREQRATAQHTAVQQGA